MTAAGWDWQFVAVTLAALWGGWVLLRPLLPWRRAGKSTGTCGSCSSTCTKGSAAAGGSSGLVSLGGANPRPRAPDGRPEARYHP